MSKHIFVYVEWTRDYSEHIVGNLQYREFQVAVFMPLQAMCGESITFHHLPCPNVLCQLGMCGKPKFGSDLVFEKLSRSKFDIHSNGFPIETACSLPLK